MIGFLRGILIQKNPQEALVVSRRALALQPGAAQAVLQEARACALLGRPLEAAALVEGMAKTDLNDRMRLDALGILAILHADGVMRSACACCGAAMELKVRSGTLEVAQGVVHFAVPAKRWWDDIVFT